MKREEIQGMTPDQQKAAIMTAGSVPELEEIWASLSERGYSTSGITYMLILKQKRSLGVDLSKDDLSLIEKIEKAVAEGASKPAIRGSFDPLGGGGA